MFWTEAIEWILGLDGTEDGTKTPKVRTEIADSHGDEGGARKGRVE